MKDTLHNKEELREWEKKFDDRFPTLGTMIVDVGGDTDEVDMKEEIKVFIGETLEAYREEVRGEIDKKIESLNNRMHIVEAKWELVQGMDVGLQMLKDLRSLLTDKE